MRFGLGDRQCIIEYCGLVRIIVMNITTAIVAISQLQHQYSHRLPASHFSPNCSSFTKGDLRVKVFACSMSRKSLPSSEKRGGSRRQTGNKCEIAGQKFHCREKLMFTLFQKNNQKLKSKSRTLNASTNCTTTRGFAVSSIGRPTSEKRLPFSPQKQSPFCRNA